MDDKHVVYEPEWVIDTSGGGSFRVECECGWERSGFDTASSARAAAFDHSARGAERFFPTNPGAAPSTDPRGPGTGRPARRRRFWHRD